MFKYIEFVKSVYNLKDLPPPELPEIAFLGRSNVGKSSLINAFLERKNIARISSTPGFTKAINFFRIDFRFCLVDLPGYGFAKVPLDLQKKWKFLIEGYLRAVRDLRSLVLIFDIKRTPDQLDINLLEFVKAIKKSFCIVLNKIDTLSKSEIKRHKEMYYKTLNLTDKVSLFQVSCKEKIGIDEFRRFIISQIKS